MTPIPASGYGMGVRDLALMVDGVDKNVVARGLVGHDWLLVR
jgi:hypothetical protein